jgi:hypothetical protein
VASGLLFITRSPVLALPEVIIALIERPGSRPMLHAFAMRMGLVCTCVLAVLAFTPLGGVYFGTLIGVNDTLAGLAAAGLQVGVLLPLVMAQQSWFRGLLTAERATPAITLAMGTNVAVMAMMLAAGVGLRLPGVALAAAALLVSSSAETLTLWVAAHRRGLRQTAVAAAD